MGVYLCDSVVRVASLPSKTRLFRSILGSNFAAQGQNSWEFTSCQSTL